MSPPDPSSPRRRPGPKPRPDAERRTHRVAVHLTDSEHARLVERAGSPARIAAHLRGAGLGNHGASGSPVVPPLHRQAWRDLTRLAADLRRHQRAVEAGQIAMPYADLDALREAVAALRAELLAAMA